MQTLGLSNAKHIEAYINVQRHTYNPENVSTVDCKYASNSIINKRVHKIFHCVTFYIALHCEMWLKLYLIVLCLLSFMLQMNIIRIGNLFRNIGICMKQEWVKKWNKQIEWDTKLDVEGKLWKNRVYRRNSKWIKKFYLFGSEILKFYFVCIL